MGAGTSSGYMITAQLWEWSVQARVVPRGKGRDSRALIRLKWPLIEPHTRRVGHCVEQGAEDRLRVRDRQSPVTQTSGAVGQFGGQCSLPQGRASQQCSQASSVPAQRDAHLKQRALAAAHLGEAHYFSLTGYHLIG